MADTSVVSYCSSHASKVLQGLDNLRTHGKLVDTKLCVGGHEIPCHRAVLSSCSEYFEAMFCGDTTESQVEKIQIWQVGYEAMKAVVDFAYTAKVTITEENAQSLLEASNLLQVLPIKDACADFLQRQLDPSNCLGILQFADTMSCQQLLKAARKYVLKEFLEVVKQEEFLQLTSEELCRYISDDDLNAEKEETVYNAVMAWVSHDSEERTKALPKVMAHVRFPFMDPVFLVKTVETNGMVASSPEIQAFLREARLYSLTPEEISSQRTKPRKVSGLSYVVVVVGNQARPGHEERPWQPTACYYNPDYQYAGWINLCELPEPTAADLDSPVFEDFAVTTVGNNIMISGGTLSRETLGDTWIYEPHVGLWKAVAAMNAPRYFHTLSVLHGKVYAIGGSSDRDVLNCVEVYSPASNNWSLCSACLPERLWNHTAVSVDGKMYVIGGVTSSGEGCSKVLSCAFSDANEDWRHVSSLPEAMRWVTAAAVQSDVYIVGPGPSEDAPSFLCYKPHSDTWIHLKHRLNWPERPVLFTMTECTGKLYIIQLGENFHEDWQNGSFNTDVALVYDPLTDTMEQLDKLAMKNYSVSGCVTILKNFNLK
ncbi:KLHL24 [Branchiostoma lanceolatum]|uniref:KLHL24 protein n=1 Tax=Branchiostoma lanceolatum TaxID=7740 RepID=A0A8J9YQY5_BRALA|nr:KLHL24 [Branchiostoma lanceolatum]